MRFYAIFLRRRRCYEIATYAADISRHTYDALRATCHERQPHEVTRLRREAAADDLR